MRAIALGARLLAALFQVPDDVILRYMPMVAPLPKSFQESLQRAAVDGILASFWKETQGFHSDLLVESSISKEKLGDLPSPSTYGEITTTGARQVFNYMELYGRSEATVTFMDLGSGTGKLVTHGSLELQCLELAVGIELDLHRHSIGMANLERLRKINKDYGSVVVAHLYCGDILDANVSTATHIYISSLCFTKKMMLDLVTKLQNEALNLECVATLQPFPQAEQIDNSWRTFALSKTEYIEMSWTKPFGCPVLFYCLNTCDQKQP
jgi:hypothetical protein